MPPASYLAVHAAAELSEAEWRQLFNGLELLAAHSQQP